MEENSQKTVGGKFLNLRKISKNGRRCVLKFKKIHANGRCTFLNFKKRKTHEPRAHGRPLLSALFSALPVNATDPRATRELPVFVRIY